MRLAVTWPGGAFSLALAQDLFGSPKTGDNREPGHDFSVTQYAQEGPINEKIFLTR
jgi:hypothetical protein